MSYLPHWLFARGTLAALGIITATLACAIGLYFAQATTLVIAVAPRDGTEPDLLKAYASALDAGRQNVRLKILSFEDVSESAQALRDGRADLAVVRPDISLPGNALTLAILRDQAILIVSPESAGLTSFTKLGGRRLGIASRREADLAVLKTIAGYYGLKVEPSVGSQVSSDSVHLVAIEESEASAAINDRRIDAFVSIIAPAAPKALALVEAIKGTSKGGKVNFIDVSDGDAIIERFPMLQDVTIPAGLFGGHPKLPVDEVKSVGSSYRLMARSTLSRTTAAEVTQHLFELRTTLAATSEAANYIVAPTYETTAEATSARIPIHPGAMDYFEREQRGFIDRYGDSLYLLGAIAGGVVSALAWLQQRVSSLRRERIDEVIDRLLEISSEARSRPDLPTLHALSLEVDRLAGDAVRYARERSPDTSAITAVEIALTTARATISDYRAPPLSERPA